MYREYTIASPSLEGLLSDGNLVYEGVVRPVEAMRVLDGPRTRGSEIPDLSNNRHEREMLEKYFDDLYRVFMKKLSHFVVESGSDMELTLKLQAMLQEMIKVKRILGK